MAGTFTVYNTSRGLNANVTVNATGAYSVLLCTNATASQYYVDSFQLYETANYDQRAWFLLNTTINPTTTSNVSLYLSNTTNNKLTQITLLDDNNLPLEGYYIRANRYYPSLNEYRGVAMLLTDENGEATSYLTPNDVWYRFTVYNAYEEVIYSFVPAQTMYCDPADSSCAVTLTIGGNIVGEYWQTFGEIAFNLSQYTNATHRFFTAQVIDTSGVDGAFVLETYSEGLYLNETECYQTLNASSGMLICEVRKEVKTIAMLWRDGSAAFLGSEEYEPTSSPYGAAGPLMAAITLTGLILVGAATPSLSIAMGLLAIVISYWLQFFEVTATATVAVIIVGVMLIKRVRS